jgi:hypothetical protein
MKLSKITRTRILRAAHAAADIERSRRGSTTESIRSAYKRAWAREWNRACYAQSSTYRQSVLDASARWRERQAS